MKVVHLHQEEQAMIQLAVDNNRQAQQQIYSKFSPKMLSICRLYVKDVQQAEDVMITAFMKVFISLKNFQNLGSFEGWIRRIVVNECISFLRVNKKVTFIDDGFYKEETTAEDEYEIATDDIQLLIDNLPEGYKMVFNLYAIEGHKHKEIAEMLGINEGTSKSQLSHARKILQQQIKATNKFDYGTK